MITRKEVQTLCTKKLVSICVKPSLKNGPKLHFFICLIDTCLINAESVLAMNKHTEPRKQNLFKVGFSLVSG